ncbi:MAG: TetR/AcrR family transcriptional regulator [Candidatus Nanopelagicales bacterium]|jgi:AcrR family transcriptional regulator|nr:TetR/AcrR family transcriptional regulator [Candidatus Nanopelagicales bacterium]
MPGYVRAPERREQLLAAARRVLVREGLGDLTLRDVAAEAGVHLSTLQYIFSSRGELVHALAERVLVDAGFGQFEVGDGGLARELERQLEWYRGQLHDPAMAELVRHEYVTTVHHSDPAAPADLPVGRRLLIEDATDRVQQIGQRAGEAYARSPQELARLWTVSILGLLHAFLQDADLDRFRRDGQLVVDALVELARPAPG